MSALRTRLLVVAGAVLVSAAPGRDPAEHFRLLTSDPSADYAPTVSTDGRHLVFVSERDGDQELYATRLDARIPEAPTALAPSAASDTEPTLSPDRRWLAWTSTREDAFGDVMVMAFPNGNPQSITERGIRDDSPQWLLRDGKLILTFRSTPLNGDSETLEVVAGRWKDVRPAGDRAPAPPLPFGATVAAEPVDDGAPWLLHADDTNGDGVLSEGDRPSVWEYSEGLGRWRQVTPPLAGLNAPRNHGGRLVVGVNLRGNLDIAILEKPFPVAEIRSAVEARELAANLWEANPFDPYLPVGVCRQGVLAEPGTMAAVDALALALDVLRESHRPEQALEMLDWASDHGLVPREVPIALRFRRVVLTADSAERAGLGRDALRAVFREASRELANFAGQDADGDMRSVLLLEAARLALRGEDAPRAVELSEQAENVAGASRAACGRAALVRSRIYERLDLADQILGAYEEVLKDYADVADVVEEAALRLTEVAATHPAPDTSPIASVRQSADLVPDSIALGAASLYRQGRLLADSGDSKQAREAWLDAMAMREEVPRLAARAAFALAELLAQEGEFAESIETYESVAESMRGQFFPGAPAFYEQAREGLVREYLNKGNYELRVGDAALAANTFGELIAVRPELVEAWRGYLDARDRSGTLDKDLIREYERAAKAAPSDALAQYRYGLALTYRLPIGKEAVRRLQAAIVLDGSVPYFHQTLGFVHEHFGRTREDRQETAEALLCYQRALALLDSSARPTDYARLLVNAGNAAMGLDSASRAAELYRRRVQSGEPFTDDRTEFLMYRSYGIALFRTAKPREAAVAFQSALGVISALVNYGMITNSQAVELETELLDRQALAFMEAGALERSAEQFGRVAERHGEHSLSRVRALRNRGFVLHRHALAESGIDREELLREAETSIRAALDLATNSRLVDDRESAGGGGLFSIEKTLSAGEAGGARQGFAPDEEVRLLQSALAKILQDRGRTEEAIEALRAELRAEPKLNDGNRTYYLTIRLVTLDRLASQLIDAGRLGEAAEALIQAIEVARFPVGDTVQTNANGLSVVLSRLTEVALAGDEPPFDGSDLAGTWLLAGESKSGDGNALDRLDRALEAALSLRTPDGAEHVLSPPVQRARLELARALLAERRAQLGAGSGLSLIAASADRLRAEALARSVARMPRQSLEGGEVKRLAILARGLLVRSALQRGDSDSAHQELADALAFATESGFEGWRWWLEAQWALFGDSEEAAGRVLAELENLLPGTMIEPERIPWPLLEHCEDLGVRSLAGEGDWEAAWDWTARWRVARLRLAFDQSQPMFHAESAGEADWLNNALRVRRQLGAAMERLQAQPSGTESRAARASLDAVAEELRTHLERGRASGATGASLLAPEALPLEEAAIFLEDGMPLPAPAALVLATRLGTAAWTAQGFRKLGTDADWDSLAGEAGVWFVLGEPLASSEALVINMPTVEGTYRAIENLWLEMGQAEVSFPGAENLSGEELMARLREDMPFAAKLAMTEPLRPDGPNPLRWQIGETPMPLGLLVASLPPPSSIRVELADRPGSTAAERRAQEIALAASFSFASAGEVHIGNHRWVGANFSPTDLSDYAEAEIDALFGSVGARVRRGELARAAVPSGQLMRLLRIMEKPTEQIMQAGLMAAQIQRDLGRFREAARITGELADIARQAGDSGMLRQVLAIQGDTANSAREFEAAEAAYREAAALSATAGDTDEQLRLIASAGVALENGGHYPEALEAYHEALELAEASGEIEAQIAQWERIGRIRFLRQNRYEEASLAFARALELALDGNDSLAEMRARLDLARVDERLGRYDSAIEAAEAMELRARQEGMPLLEVDAILLRAFVEWARASYLEAFQAERKGLEMARQLNDRPFQIIAHNTAGLIHWSLNDSSRAIDEFQAALELAKESLFPGEVASSHNNLGLVMRSLEDFDAALGEFRAALQIDRDQGNRWGIAYAQKNIGITRIQSGAPGRAIEPLEEAIALSEEIGDLTNNTKSLVAMGDARRDLKEDDAARLAYEDALKQAREIPLPEMEWRALYGLAVLARRAGDLEKTQQHLAAAITVVEGLRARIKIEEFQDGFLLDKQSLYDEMIALLLDRGEALEAFNFSERSRGRNFIDLLGNQRIDFASAQDRDSMERDHRLRSRIETIQRRLATLTEEEREDTLAELDAAKQEYSNFLVELRASNPQLSTFVEVQPVDVAEVQSLLEADTRLIVYHLLPEEAVAWVIGPAAFNVVRTPVGRDELTARIGAMRERMQEFAAVDEELEILSQWLIAPLADLIEPASRVGIVPHRQLHLMPFAALTLREESVVDRVALFHAPSASVLRYTFGRRGLMAGNLKVLAVGNPQFERAEMNLPFAEKEVDRISWTFPDADVIKGEQATEAWVVENIGDYGIIHLATHGQYDGKLPLLSGIQLSSSPGVDGELTARDVFGLSLRADLVALSACQTGLGQVTSGDEVVGLNRAFVYAGTRQILSSLWRVDDVSTAVLVKHFYRNVAETNRAEALRRAQREVRKRYPHPAHWSGLFLTGDWM